MTQTTIIIEGNEVPVDQLSMIMRFNIDTIQGHAMMCINLADIDDQLYRARMAAAYFSANTAIALCSAVDPVLASGNVPAFKAAMEIAGHMNKHHKGFWDAFGESFEHRDTPLPDDLETRRAGISAKLDAAIAAAAALKVDVAALAADSAARVSAELVLPLVDKAISEASSSVSFATGVPKMDISDDDVNRLIAETMTYLTGEGGKTEEEARAMIAEKLGTTMEEHKAAITAQQMAPLAPTSEGSLNGSLLSAEAEVETVEYAVGKIKELISAAA